MRRPSLYLLPLLSSLLLLSSPAAAVRVDGLYRAEVEVADKGREARESAFREALERVIVRITGRAGVLSNPALGPLLERPQAHVQQYRYETIEPDPEAEGEAADSADEAAVNAEDGAAADEEEAFPRYRLEVVFARRAIDDLLSERGIAVWDVYRPQVLVWLAFDDGRERRLVAADENSGIDEALREGARRRGVPLLLPLLDTEDQRRIEYLDIQGGFLDRVREASARYQAGLVLTGHVYRTADDQWRGEWMLLDSAERRSWLTRAGEAAGVVRAGIDGVAERLAEQLAGQKDELRRVRLQIENVKQLDDYARLGRYLERLPRIDGQRVVRIRPTEVLFELSLRGQLSDLERAIALDDLLSPVRPAASADAPGVDVLAADEAPTEEAPTEEAPADSASRRPAGGPVYGFGRENGPDGDASTRGPDLIYRLAG